MSKEKLLLCYRILGIITSIAVVLTGICFIVGCLTIYNSGDQPYSGQSVAEQFERFDGLVYTTIFLALVSTCLEFVLNPTLKTKQRKSYRNILDNLKSKKDLAKAPNDIKNAVVKVRNKRKILSVIRTIVIIASVLVFLSYALNANNFHKSEINDSMIKAMWVLVPCLTVSFIYSVFTSYYCEASYRRELELIKQLPNTTEENNDETTKKPKLKTIIRIIMLVIAAAILIYGYFTGGTADVLTKAINICTECIGLG